MKFISIMIIGLIFISIGIIYILTKQDEKKMKHSEVLVDKPSFNLDITSSQARIAIVINNIIIFENFSNLPIKLDHNINEYLGTGTNEIKVIFMGSDGLKEINTEAEFNIKFFVRKFSDFTSPTQTIWTLDYKHNQKKPLENSSKIGKYNSLHQFKPDMFGGDIEIIEQKIKPYLGGPAYLGKGIMVTMKFSLVTPYSRWSFFDAEPILDIDKPFYALTMDEYNNIRKNNPKIKKLYELNYQIYKLVKEKNIDKLIEFFNERSIEYDQCFYDEKGQAKKELKEALTKIINNVDYKHYQYTDKQWDNHEPYFYIDFGNKVAYIQNVLGWNLISEPGSKLYDMKFMYKNEEWRLVR